MKRYLRLQGGWGDKWAVLVYVTLTHADEAEEIGTVRKCGGHWQALDAQGRNHGDRYLDRWGAARQLALGLGMRIE